MRIGKKGEVTVGTLVAIVLAIVVIAFLVYGFSTGWTNLWGKIGDFGGESNVDDITLACELACQQQGKDAFCNVKNEVRLSEQKNVSEKGTVADFKLRSKYDATCFDLSNDTALGKKRYNVTSAIVDGCSKIVCN